MIKAKYLLLMLLFPATAFCQEIRILPGEVIPEIKNIGIQVSVSYKPSAIYIYSYKISNFNINKGAISDIDIDITAADGSMSLSSEGLKYGQGYLRGSSQGISAKLADSIIPVGISAPADWVAGISVRGTASWGAAEDSALISSGSSKNGFEMNSRGLPGLRELIVKPDFKQQPVEEATEQDVQRIKSIEEKIAFRSKTIGPTAPPANFRPAAFLDYIINLKHEASSLGWIKNKGIEKSLDAKLDNAKKKLEQGLPRAAANILTAFINEVEAQGCASYDNCPPGKHLTSAAYALLKYNAQYLIDNLK